MSLDHSDILMSYHNKILNLDGADGALSQADRESPVTAYLNGHRDARHAAAEIAVTADAEIEELRAVLADVLGAWGDGFRMGDPRETQIFQKAIRIAKGK